MPQITFAQAKDFLNNISEKDNVAIIHHDDGDGLASGIMLYDWCKQKKAKAKTFTFSFKKWNKKTDLTLFDKILIADIGPDGIEEIHLPQKKQIFYTDHHKENQDIPEEILELRTTKEGYIPSSRTVGELTNLKPWLALAGTISDAGDLYPENDDYINNGLEKCHQTLEDFKENVVYIITNSIIYFQEDLDKSFEIFQKINTIEEVKQLKKYSKPIEDETENFVNNFKKEKEFLGKIIYYYFEPKYPVKKAVTGIISRTFPKETLLFAVPQDKYVSISARNQSREEDMIKLVKAGVQGLEDTNAGGHKAAAGAMIRKQDLEKFKENIKSYSS